MRGEKKKNVHFKINVTLFNSKITHFFIFCNSLTISPNVILGLFRKLTGKNNIYPIVASIGLQK